MKPVIIKSLNFSDIRDGYQASGYPWLVGIRKGHLIPAIEPLRAQTAIIISNYVQSGGKVIFIWRVPERLYSLKDALNNGITNVVLNDRPLSTRWYGKHFYDISNSRIKGKKK